VPCGHSAHGSDFKFIPKNPEITIDGSAIVPSTVSTFITWLVRFATLDRYTSMAPVSRSRCVSTMSMLRAR